MMASHGGALTRSSVDLDHNMRPPSPPYDGDPRSPRANLSSPPTFEIPMQYSEESPGSVAFHSPSQYEESSLRGILPGSVTPEIPSQYPEERSLRGTVPESMTFETPSQYPEESSLRGTVPESVIFETPSQYPEERSLRGTVPESMTFETPSQYPEEIFPESFASRRPPQFSEENALRATVPASFIFENPARYSKHTQQRQSQPLSEEYLLQKQIITEILSDVAYGIDMDTWGYLSYMEYNKRHLGIYVTENEFLIDNSANPMDSKSLGLSSLPPPPRNSQTAMIKFEVHKGIVLLTDPSGDIYLINESKIPVIVKGWEQPEKFCLSEEVIRLHGSIKPGNEMVKVFDIEEFRSHIGLQLVNNDANKDQLRHMSFISLCFGEAQPDLQSPCWFLLSNIKAFNMADDEAVRADVQEYIAQLSCAVAKPSEKKKGHAQPPPKHQEARRKLRIELRKQGKLIADHVKYSWNDVYFKNEASQLNLQTLRDQFEDPDVDSEEDGKNTQLTENQLQQGLERLKTIVRKTTRSPKRNEQPIKHWAKLSYKIKQYSGTETAY